MSAVLFLTTSFVFSVFLTGVYLKYANAHGVMDIPNERSSHQVPTPRGGGVSIILVALGGILFLYGKGDIPARIALALFSGPLLVGIVGFIDDHVSLRALWRLLCHCVAVFFSLVLLGEMPVFEIGSLSVSLGLLAIPLFTVGIVWFLNLYNFMDGIDGIAASEAICLCGSAAIILWLLGDEGLAMLPLSLAAASAGFLVWNWSPAKVFMGDAASGFLGISLGLMAVLLSTGSGMNFFAWLVLAGVFVTDATWTLVRRGLRGEKVYEAHRSHAYQRASRKLGGHAPVTLSVIAINIFWLAPIAWFACVYPHYSGLLLGLAYLPLLGIAWWLGAGLPDEQ